MNILSNGTQKSKKKIYICIKERQNPKRSYPNRALFFCRFEIASTAHKKQKMVSIKFVVKNDKMKKIETELRKKNVGERVIKTLFT